MYNIPKYYEIAFNYREIDKEVGFLEDVFRTHSNRKVRSVLDIACGTCSHLLKLAKKGYIVGGLDISTEMLEYARKRFDQNNFKARLLKSNMRKFKTDKYYDSVICMGDSLAYLLEDEEYYSHLDSVAKSLEKGGLYIVDLDNPEYWFGEDSSQELYNEWKMQDGDIEVKTQLHRYPIDSENRIHRVKTTLGIRDGEKRDRSETYHDVRALFPDEFRDIINAENNFELLEYYGDFSLEQKLDSGENSWRIIAALLRK